MTRRVPLRRRRQTKVTRLDTAIAASLGERGYGG